MPIYADADFCIVGRVDPQAPQKLEGPFGDHLGYYSLAHEFPVLQVEQVYHRQDAVWPFTVVGRPPQEDTTFGQLIHELTGDVIPTVLPGVKAVHAVDAAGVHPLLLAIGSERYTPFLGTPRPQELLTQACAILGQGQLSLAKFLLIVNRFDDEQLDIHDIPAFLQPSADAGRLAARSAFSYEDNDRHARLFGRRAQHGLESRDRGGGAADPRIARRIAGRRELTRRLQKSAAGLARNRDRGGAAAVPSSTRYSVLSTQYFNAGCVNRSPL